MNSSKGDSVPDKFPAGLRVLVVDDDPSCLKILEKMLRLCHYEGNRNFSGYSPPEYVFSGYSVPENVSLEVDCTGDVTTCSRATVALSLLREKSGSFDLVITDVYMPDMDGFKLLEHVGLELDLPVIMMSVDVEVKAAMKGLKHGACFYLMKPVSMEELKNIWQHVVRKKKSQYKEPENLGSVEDSEILRKTSADLENVSLVNEGIWKHPKRKKDVEEESEREENDDSSTLKKQRLVWLPELHQQFLAAVNQLGFDKAVPKKILELMNVPGLTRENVASHLQKFRLLLRRLSEITQPQGCLASTFQGGASNTRFGLSAFEFQSLAGSPHFSQPHNLMPMQSGFEGKAHNPNTATAMPALDSLHFFNQDPQSSSPLAKLSYDQPLLDNEGNFLQALPNSRSEPTQISHMQGNDRTSGFNIGSHQLTMAGQMSGDDLDSCSTAVQLIHQRHQQMPEQISGGKLDTFSMVQMLPNGNHCCNLSNTRSGRLYGKACRRLSQAPLDYINSCVSDSNGSYSPLSGSSQGGLTCKALSNINLSNYMLDEFSEGGKQDWQLDSMVPGLEADSLSIPEIGSSNSGYACNGMASPGRFQHVSQYDGRWRNGIQQQNNICARTIGDGLSDVVTSLKSKNSLCHEPFPHDGLSDLVLQQLQDGADHIESEFDIAAYQVDDSHL